MFGTDAPGVRRTQFIVASAVAGRYSSVSRETRFAEEGVPVWPAILLLALVTDTMLVPSGQIAFMREGKVCVIGADGSDERALTDALFIKTERPITWSPDGRKVLFWNHSKIGWDIWAVTADGNESANLTQVKSGGCRSPSPSPDGKWIAFLRDDPEGLYLMDAHGSNQRRLSNKGFRDLPPSWSPDNKRLAYTVLEDGKFFIYAHDLFSGRDVRIGPGSSPSWSPDGTGLLFVGVRDNRLLLGLISSDGTNEVRLTKGPEQPSFPAWSPDGTRVSYFASREGKLELRVATTDQKTDALLASVAGRSLSAPSWSPDGRWLAFAAGQASSQAIYVVDDKGHDMRRLVTGGACYPAWRPTSK
jgi:TolB protein